MFVDVFLFSRFLVYVRPTSSKASLLELELLHCQLRVDWDIFTITGHTLRNRFIRICHDILIHTYIQMK